jgi:molybdopterin-containing oxidoreductase family iron-sulfur binding subunit
MPRYGMVVDLKKCIGCHSCVLACKSEHNAPSGVLQTNVLEKELGKFPNSVRLFLPVLCNHCEKPTCVDVCPTDATYKRDDGVVMIDFRACIGCGACVEHCPYHARVLVQDNRTLFPDGKTAFEKPVQEKIPAKVAVKCDLCYFRIEKGLDPACVEVCPTGSRIFGDLSDQEGRLVQLVRDYKGWQMLPEKGTDPSVYYIG